MITIKTVLRQLTPVLVQAVLCGFPLPSHALEQPTHHLLTVELDPEKEYVRIEDEMLVHPDRDHKDILHLRIHGKFNIESINVMDGPGWRIQTAFEPGDTSITHKTRITFEKPSDRPWPRPLLVRLRYAGPVTNPLKEPGKQPAPTTPHTLVLSSFSYFYPQVDTGKSTPERVTFRMTVNTPSLWRTVSQGKKTADMVKENRRTTTWETTNPMEEIFLIADRYEETTEPNGDRTFYTYLIGKEPELAGRYLKATQAYIDFYEKILGPYPYEKFALVENSRQTGFGMPSFTLLGSRVLRFPFILHTSFPHEILHNWWGNGVYIDRNSGNWSEGLTAYLSDHLMLELEGKGDQYRFQELMKYMSYVTPENDFPLTEFQSRESMASQAVGYGKMLMVLHMLRREVGNAKFLDAVRHFYRTHRFQFAGLDDLRASFEKTSGRSFGSFFRQWTERAGAPELQLSRAEYQTLEDRYAVRFEVLQTQAEDPFWIRLPVAVWVRGSDSPRTGHVIIAEREQTFTLEFKEEPRAVLIDPYTDVFRRLNPQEVPPSIGQTYGSSRPGRVLASSETFPDLQMGYHEFAQALETSENAAGPLLQDDSPAPLPEGSLWVFGKDNQFARFLKPQLEWYGIKVGDAGILVEGKIYPWEDHSFVFTLQHPAGPGTVTWLIASSRESIPGLLRKLPHYGKYGYLVFEGAAPDNRVKGIWPLKHTGMLHAFHKGDYPLPPRPPLAGADLSQPLLQFRKMVK